MTKEARYKDVRSLTMSLCKMLRLHQKRAHDVLALFLIARLAIHCYKKHSFMFKVRDRMLLFESFINYDITFKFIKIDSGFIPFRNCLFPLLKLLTTTKHTAFRFWPI